MPLKDPPKRERVTELVDMARRRTRRSKDEPEWATGLQLIAYGILLNIAAGLVYLAVTAAAATSASAGPAILALGCAVASTVGGFLILGGIIRWAVQPLIYYQKKLLERMEREDRTPKPPIDGPTA